MRLAVVAAGCLISVYLDQAANLATTTAMPYMTGSVGASGDEGRLLVAGYLMPYFVTLLASPWALARYGRNRVWFWTHVVFAVASLGCAAAYANLDALVFWRFVQGAAQGTFFVSAVSCILTIFPPKTAFIGFSIFAGTSLSGAATGPLLGGYFVDINAWTGLFAVLALLAFAAAALIVRAAPDMPIEQPLPPIDGFGLALALAASLFFNAVVQFGESRDWLSSPQIVIMLVLGAVTLVAFVLWEGVFARAPFLDLRILRFHNLRWGAILGFTLGVPLFGGTTLEQYFETTLRFTPTLAGEALALRLITIVTVVPFVAYALNKKIVDPRWIILPGFALLVISYALQWYFATATAYFGNFVVSILCSGAGFAMLFSPIASTILNVLPQRSFTRGIASFKFLLTAGGTLATLVLLAIVDRRESVHDSDLGSALVPGVPAYDALVAVVHPAAAVAAPLLQLVQLQARTLAYADSFLYTAMLVALIAPLAFALQPPPK